MLIYAVKRTVLSVGLAGQGGVLVHSLHRCHLNVDVGDAAHGGVEVTGDLRCTAAAAESIYDIYDYYDIHGLT